MKTTTDKIVAKQEGPIGFLIFNNPERRNAVSLEMWQAAGEVLDAFSKDDSVRVIVLAGRGQSFVASADISSLRTNAPTPKLRKNIPPRNAHDPARHRQTDRGDDPRLLYRRRHVAGALLRHAHLLG
jgi:enoyl-CoA hydratase/carnithine racemase